RQLLHQIPPGAARATDYHRFIAGILELIFYPYLQCPQIEYPIHEGRKRIDITFDNAARDGFFYRLHTTHKIPSAYIVVECKNYSADPDNPELDQLAGRFSINRGQAGLLMCRRLDDDTIFLRRCTDTYKDGRGLILPFTDEDLDLVLRTIAHTSQNPVDELLSNKLRLVALA
ncbi:MAG: hypothetical protein SVV80_13390, partial [Planctomycetota bacterium]|nr:hypothetical protein [Planctomycetota bacterium]